MTAYGEVHTPKVGIEDVAPDPARREAGLPGPHPPRAEKGFARAEDQRPIPG